MGKINWISAIVALLYLGLVWLIILFCGSRTETFDEFSQYWGLFSVIVGVVTGAIPSFFFRDQAKKAEEAAEEAGSVAKKAVQRAEIYASLAPANSVADMRKLFPSMFD